MKSRELNLKLLELFPDIRDQYIVETSWQEGSDTGSHVVYEDVFVPYIRQQINNNQKEHIDRIFTFLEELLNLDDTYATEVVALSVLEPLVCCEDVNNSLFLQHAKEKTLEAVEKIILSY